ncbi:MAG TPA: hypothetical protein VER11_29645 [Polyangiaceae bacterium]|nr:hypothetical protein [Polyangiaceae bacterium]
MNWQLRALLVLVPVLALGGVVLLSTGSKSKPVPPRGSGGAPSEVQTRSVPSDSAVSVVAAPPPPPSKPSVVPEKPTEDSLATAMHALEDTDPEQALELARHGQALWPNGTLAAEFAATEVKCLYRLGMPSEGRGAAEAMVNKYPTSKWALEVERQTGAHPHVDH